MGGKRGGWPAGWRATLAVAVVAGPTILTLAAGAGPAAADQEQASTTPSTLLPAVSLPPVTLPPVSLPGVTVPPVTLLPSVTVPPVTLPPLLQTPTAAPPAAPPPSSPGTASAAPAAANAQVSPLPVEPAVVPPSRGEAPGGGASPLPAASAAPPPRSLPLRLRNAAAETAERLSFPLGLAGAILAFLVVQPRLDRGDPAVARRRARPAGPLGGEDDDLLGFS